MLWLILGLKTCEVFFRCFLAIIFLGSIVLTSKWLLVLIFLRHLWVSQVFIASMSLILSPVQLLITLKVETETKVCSLVLAKLLYHNDFARKGQENIPCSWAVVSPGRTLCYERRETTVSNCLLLWLSHCPALVAYAYNCCVNARLLWICAFSVQYLLGLFIPANLLCQM